MFTCPNNKKLMIEKISDENDVTIDCILKMFSSLINLETVCG